MLHETLCIVIHILNMLSVPFCGCVEHASVAVTIGKDNVEHFIERIYTIDACNVFCISVGNTECVCITLQQSICRCFRIHAVLVAQHPNALCLLSLITLESQMSGKSLYHSVRAIRPFQPYTTFGKGTHDIIPEVQVISELPVFLGISAFLLLDPAGFCHSQTFLSALLFLCCLCLCILIADHGFPIRNIALGRLECSFASLYSLRNLEWRCAFGCFL